MKMVKSLRDVFFSFPLQLLLLHFRSNLLLLGLWVLLYLLMTGRVGSMLGFHYLFLTPEYLGEVGFLSFALLGLGFGAFFMTWNLTAYLLEAHRFPFLACLERPFTKFCLNNSLVPLIFLLTFLVESARFQLYHELWNLRDVLLNCGGFLAGAISFIMVNILYFQFTNKDILSLLKPRSGKDNSLAPGQRVPDIETLKAGKAKLPVKTYLTASLRPRLVRSVAHYDAATLLRVFKQNHLNALVVQLLSLMVLVGSGYLVDIPLIMVPAGASIFVMLSVLVALIGALTYWFHEWRLTVIILLLLGINYLTSRDIFTHRNKGYGLDYEQPPVAYDVETLRGLYHPDTVAAHRQSTLQILENWKARTGEEKPPMVIACVTGGGLRSSVWSMSVIQKADSLLGGRLYDHTVLITGSSGGMMGMAYLRELFLQARLGADTIVNPYDQVYLDYMSRDILNPIAFTIVTSDLFLPWATFSYDGHTYRKDRGYIFEQQLNRNTRGVLEKAVGDYREVEKQALVPMVFLTPSIVNDGRRLVISPQGVSYMMVPPAGVDDPGLVEMDAIDFGGLFAQHDAYNLRFTSALRMNATFPYVLPNVYLPTYPGIEVMDAGFRDNYGIMSAARFIHVFRDWIQENTGGVVLLQIRGQDKFSEMDLEPYGVVESILVPFGVAGRLTDLQEYEHDSNLGYLFDLLGKDQFDIVRFIHHPSEEAERTSVTFHLTQREKENILQAFQLKKNQESMRQLTRLLDK